MNTMQAFYMQLFSTQDPYWAGLMKLTRLNLTQIKSIASELIWSIWD